MVNVGIIGLGPRWETVYRPALERLRERIVVRAVYDTVADRAELVASECGAIAVPGITELLQRVDLKAIICVDPMWQGFAALELVCRKSSMPILFCSRLPNQNGNLDRLGEIVKNRDATVVPALPERLTPATRRLQELMASRIGRPHSILIDATVATGRLKGGLTGLKGSLANQDRLVQSEQERDFLATLFDWCRFIIRTAPESVESRLQQTNGDENGSVCAITTLFSRPRSGGEPAVAELRLRPQIPAADGPAGLPDPQVQSCRVACENGSAELTSPTEITWSTDAEPVAETLQAERPAVEVLLDHFCRRVVGGLIPVAGIDDLCCCECMIHAAEESLRTGQAVPL